ncbi:MAG: FctA domain-containing protein [Collinsella bouchesdurhonensis]|nr:FctA domain-containing protein [Collinsella bouchesdurhonensis]
MELKRSIRARAARLVAMFAMALVCALVLVPSAYADGAVARIDETGSEYNTFDEAVAAAKNGETVTLLADAETAGLNLNEDLTIDGDGHALKFTDKGIALWGHALVLKNVNASMASIGSTPYTAEWNWQSVCASKGASLTLDGAALTMDGAGTASKTHAIYFCSNNKLNLKNASTLTIKNYSQDALEWDGGDGGYNVNIEGGSTFVSDHNRSGFTGSFYATVDSSTVKVINSTGNGSNGTYYTIKNNSDVTFENSGNWGISAWRIDMSNGSKLHANNNGYSGVWTRVLNVDSSCTVDVEGNGAKGFAAKTNGGIFFQGNGKIVSVIEKGANVIIENNAGSGIYTAQKACNLTIGSATIINNGTGVCNEDGIGADMGGGVYNVGTMKLDPSVVIYNNHAKNAGDDIYGTGVTEFGNVGNDWVLDDCNHAINGWFDDSQGARWCAHWTDNTPWHVKAVKAGTYETPVALKAAHGVTAAHAEISGTKVLKGAQLAEGDFEFTLSQNDDVISHAKNAADGSFTFGESAFDVTADDIMHTDNHKVSYTLDVAEVKGNKANVTYDTSVKKVVVTAVPEDDHVKLTYSVDGKDVEDLASALVFTNTYTKPAEPSEPKTPGTSTKQNLPKTGDASLAAPVAFILAAAVACGAGVVMRRRG